MSSTAEDIKSDEEMFEEGSPKGELEEVRVTPVSFHAACIAKAEVILNKPLVKITRTSYQTPDNLVSLTCAVSKVYPRDNKELYWFAFHPHYKEFLVNSNKGYVLFGCGSVDNLIFIPISQFVTWLNDLWVTEKGGRTYWHVHIAKEGNRFFLLRSKGSSPVDITQYLI